MLVPGQILQERYQLQQQLGRTAAGRKTWLALDLQTEPQEKVVVKLLAFSPEMQWDELKLFEREARILQTIDRPRIPRYRDYFSLEADAGAGLPWFALVQDYIPGANLQELLERGKRFEEAQLRQLAAEMLDILIYLHELSPPVLHRDIKPSNLILANGDRIYLIDFGSVQDKAAVTGMTFTVVGTSGYAPLEQFWGRAIPSSDLYALGATLIHLLTGIAPADLPQRENRIQFGDRVSLSSGLLRWIEKLTEPAIEKRFSSAREALAALESGLLPVAAPETNSFANIEGRPQSDRISIHISQNQLVISLSPDSNSEFLKIITNSIGLFTAICLLIFPFAIGYTGLLYWYLYCLLFCVSSFCAIRFFDQKKDHRTVAIFNRQYFEIKTTRVGTSKSYIQKGVTSELGQVLREKNEFEDNILIVSPEYSYRINVKNMTNNECIILIRDLKSWLKLR